MEREIFADGRAAGTLRTEPDGADTCFSLSCRLGPGLWRLWAEGTAGRLLLGTLEGGGPVTLRRRFSDRLVWPGGAVGRRPAGEGGAARGGAGRPATGGGALPPPAAPPGGRGAGPAGGGGVRGAPAVGRPCRGAGRGGVGGVAAGAGGAVLPRRGGAAGGRARAPGGFGLARGGSLRGGCPLPADGAVLSRADRNGRRAAVRGVRLRRVRLARPARRFREAIKNSHLVYHLPALYDIMF